MDTKIPHSLQRKCAIAFTEMPDDILEDSIRTISQLALPASLSIPVLLGIRQTDKQEYDRAITQLNHEFYRTKKDTYEQLAIYQYLIMHKAYKALRYQTSQNLMHPQATTRLSLLLTVATEEKDHIAMRLALRHIGYLMKTAPHIPQEIIRTLQNNLRRSRINYYSTDPIDNAFVIATSNNDVAGMQLLREQGAHIETIMLPASTLVYGAMLNKAYDAAPQLISWLGGTSQHGNTLLHGAIAAEDFKIAKTLIDDAIINSYDSQGYTPLIRAVYGESREYSRIQNMQRTLGLPLPQGRRYAKFITLLLKRGANPRSIDHSKNQHGDCVFDTLLHIIARNEGSPDTAQLLIQHGADPNARNKYEVTPLHLAGAWGASEIVRVLLANGANPHLVDKRGRTAQQCIKF